MTTPSHPTHRDASAAPDPGSPRNYRHLFLSLYLPAIALGLGTGVTTPVLPVLAKSFDVTIGVASLVFIAQMAGSAAATLPTGYLLDWTGRRRVLLAGPIITAVASLLVAIAGSFPELLVYRFIGGWGQQMWMLSRLTIIADTGAERQRGQQITSMFGAQRAGMLLGPIIGGGAAAAWGIRVPFVIHGMVALVAVVPSFFVIRETMPVNVPAAKDTARDGEQRPKLSWQTLLTYPIPLVFAAQFLTNVTRGGVEGGGVLYLYGVYAYGAGPVILGVLSSSVAMIGIPITLMAGVIMDRRGRKFTIVPGSILLGSAMVFMASTAFASLSFAAFVGAFIAIHIATSTLSGSMQTLGTDIAPTYARGRFFGVSRLVAQSGRVSSPTSFALLSQFAGFTAAFVFLSATAYASALLVAFFVKETLRKR